MEIKRSGSQPSAKGSAEYFTGAVRIDPLIETPEPARVRAASVTFEPGARSAWHTHPLGQTLIVTSGCGYVQSWGGPMRQATSMAWQSLIDNSELRSQHAQPTCRTDTIGWQLGIDPIPNMTALLEDRGIKVLVVPLPDGVSGLTCLVHRSRHKVKVPVIVVNENITLERRRLTLAHELAHRLIDETSPVDHEKASNVFAGAFLVPRDHLVREIGKHRKALGYQELIQLKRMYRVSAAAFLVRLKQVGIIDESTLSYAFQTFARGWRSSEPEPFRETGRTR